jgi:hypothetical protein
MATQLQPGLFDTPPPRRALTAEERFEQFHRANPQVYRLVCQYARQAKARGHERYSLKTIWCLIRFEEDTRATGDGGFVLNDLFTSHYARLVMRQEKDLQNFFELRERRRK